MTLHSRPVGRPRHPGQLDMLRTVMIAKKCSGRGQPAQAGEVAQRRGNLSGEVGRGYWLRSSFQRLARSCSAARNSSRIGMTLAKTLSGSPKVRAYHSPSCGTLSITKSMNCSNGTARSAAIRHKCANRSCIASSVSFTRNDHTKNGPGRGQSEPGRGSTAAVTLRAAVDRRGRTAVCSAY